MEQKGNRVAHIVLFGINRNIFLLLFQKKSKKGRLNFSLQRKVEMSGGGGVFVVFIAFHFLSLLR